MYSRHVPMGWSRARQRIQTPCARVSNSRATGPPTKLFTGRKMTLPIFQFKFVKRAPMGPTAKYTTSPMRLDSSATLARPTPSSSSPPCPRATPVRASGTNRMLPALRLVFLGLPNSFSPQIVMTDAVRQTGAGFRKPGRRAWLLPAREFGTTFLLPADGFFGAGRTACGCRPSRHSHFFACRLAKRFVPGCGPWRAKGPPGSGPR